MTPLIHATGLRATLVILAVAALAACAGAALAIALRGRVMSGDQRDGLQPRNPPSSFPHAGRLALVDRNGHLRGVWNGTQPYAVDRPFAALERLFEA